MYIIQQPNLTFSLNILWDWGDLQTHATRPGMWRRNTTIIWLKRIPACSPLPPPPPKEIKLHFGGGGSRGLIHTCGILHQALISLWCHLLPLGTCPWIERPRSLSAPPLFGACMHGGQDIPIREHQQGYGVWWTRVKLVVLSPQNVRGWILNFISFWAMSSHLKRENHSRE